MVPGVIAQVSPEAILNIDPDVLLFAGGIIPEVDIPSVKELGFAAVFGPGTDTGAIIEFVRAHTTVAPVPFVEELRLHQASDPFLLWETTERDLAARGIALPYWAFPWAGGTALAAYLLDHPHEVQRRRVLDLATGSGLVAIAAARAGAVEVLANDIDPLALAAVGLNAALNAVTVRTLTADLLDAPDHPSRSLGTTPVMRLPPVSSRTPSSALAVSLAMLFAVPLSGSSRNERSASKLAALLRSEVLNRNEVARAKPANNCHWAAREDDSVSARGELLRQERADRRLVLHRRSLFAEELVDRRRGGDQSHRCAVACGEP